MPIASRTLTKLANREDVGPGVNLNRFFGASIEEDRRFLCQVADLRLRFTADVP